MMGWLSCWLLLGGCEGCVEPTEDSPPSTTEVETDTDTDSDTDTDTDTDSDTDTDTDTVTPAPPCADGTWAGWDSPEGAVWVSPAGSDTAPGTASEPKRTLNAAMQATRGMADARVGLWPGSWSEQVQLKRPDGGPVTLSGCSPTESIVVSPGSHRDPVVALIGPGELTVRRLRVEGGGSGVVVVGGAVGLVEDVEVRGASGRGINLVGEATVATLRRVEVIDTRAAHGHRPAGWGIGSRAAEVVLEEVRVEGPTGFGVFAHFGSLVASSLTVEQVLRTPKNRHGTAIHVNQVRSLVLSGCQIRETGGGGILVVDTPHVDISECTVETVGASSTAPGDGLAVRRVGQASLPHQVLLKSNTVTGAARLGIAVEGDVLVTFSGNTAGADNRVSVGGSSIFADAAVDSAGSDEVVLLDTEVWPLGRAFVGEEVPGERQGYP